jgi:RepB DNA-primase from phage plasmid
MWYPKTEDAHFETAKLRNILPEMMRLAAIRKPCTLKDGKTVEAGDNLMIRPTGPDVRFVQLDDLTAERLDRVRPAAFMIHATSPGNHQAWIAVSGLPDGKEAFTIFMRRVRKAVGGNDKSASGATRVAGTENFKRKYVPDFPVVTILETVPGRVVTTSQLEVLGLVAPPEPVIVSSVISLPTFRRQRFGGERHPPDYQCCLERAPLSKEHGGPDRSSADFDFCKWAARYGWSIEETKKKLLEVSEKAQERRDLGDPGYVNVTAKNAADSVAARARQRGRGSVHIHERYHCY